MHKTKGSWNISNLVGVVRVFKDPETPEALAWMRDRSTADQWKQAVKEEKLAKKAEEEKRAAWEVKIGRRSAAE